MGKVHSVVTGCLNEFILLYSASWHKLKVQLFYFSESVMGLRGDAELLSYVRYRVVFHFSFVSGSPALTTKHCWLLCLTRCWSDTSQRRWTSKLSLSTVVCVKRFCRSQIANRRSVPMATFGSGKRLLLIFQFCVTQTTVKCLSKVYVAHATRLEKSCYYKTWCGLCTIRLTQARHPLMMGFFLLLVYRGLFILVILFCFEVALNF